MLQWGNIYEFLYLVIMSCQNLNVFLVFSLSLGLPFLFYFLCIELWYYFLKTSLLLIFTNTETRLDDNFPFPFRWEFLCYSYSFITFSRENTLIPPGTNLISLVNQCCFSERYHQSFRRLQRYLESMNPEMLTLIERYGLSVKFHLFILLRNIRIIFRVLFYCEKNSLL